MRLVLHVGMGKTGTSSIQHALRISAARLAEQKAEYLGMWFDMIDPAYRGFHEQKVFLQADATTVANGGQALLALMRGKQQFSGAETFVLSNESWSGQGSTLRPLIEVLRQNEVKVEVIAYARNPATWLPSAHVQWSIRDKMNKGAIQPFGKSARALVHWYKGLLTWYDAVGEGLQVRRYEGVQDVVADFSDAIGVSINRPKERVLERGEEAEILLRAFFNEQFDAPQRPERFDHSVMKSLANTVTLSEMAERCFDYSETDAIIAENSDLFDRLTAAIGFDLRSDAAPEPVIPNRAVLSDRITDYLVRIVLSQSVRIKNLEYRLENMKKD